MAMGLFDVIGGSHQQPFYEITSPIFNRITIHLDATYYTNKPFDITAENNQPDHIYIQSATLNSIPLERAWFWHKQLVAGGHLHLVLGPEPNKQWGHQPEDAPPSMV